MVQIEAPGSVSTPPQWATLERELITLMNETPDVVLPKYTDEDGAFLWPPSADHVGSDGVDDAFESFWNWPLLYVLGGDESLLTAAHRQFEAIIEQFSNIETPHGHPMLVEEYEQCRDWMHQGEGNLFFYNLCLADPSHERTRDRAKRFAGFYLSDADVDNYDGEQRLVKAPMNGSMGPEYCDFEAFPHNPYGHEYSWEREGLPFHDLETIDSIEDLTDPEKEEEILAALNERCGRGDTPLNLAITSLLTNAYLLSGDERYREWVREYTTAWIERAQSNDGIVPDNVGLNGEIGEYLDGRWYGGMYGWTWGGWHYIGAPLAIATENAFMLEHGADEFLELFRGTFTALLDQGIEAEPVPGGEVQLQIPHKYTDPNASETDYPEYDRFEDGWFDFKPIRPVDVEGPTHLWYASMDTEDADLLRKIRDPKRRDWERLPPTPFFKGNGGAHEQGWFEYLRGDFPEYPQRILELDRYHVQHRFRAIRNEEPADTYDTPHYLEDRNPVAEEGLLHLTMGAPRPIYNGGLLMARLRHFDPERGRPGLPPGVAALVEQVTDDRTVFTVVNLSGDHRELVVQAGAYGEHNFGTVRYGRDDVDAGKRTVEENHFQIDLPALSRVTIDAETHRYSNDPSYSVPTAVRTD